VELPLCAGDLFVPVQEGREFTVVVPPGLVGDEGIGLQHRFEGFTGAARLVSDGGELARMRTRCAAPMS